MSLIVLIQPSEWNTSHTCMCYLNLTQLALPLRNLRKLRTYKITHVSKHAYVCISERNWFKYSVLSKMCYLPLQWVLKVNPLKLRLWFMNDHLKPTNCKCNHCVSHYNLLYRRVCLVAFSNDWKNKHIFSGTPISSISTVQFT